MADDGLLLKTPAGEVDESAMTQDADTKAAAKIARGNLKGRDPITVPTIKGNDDYEALSPGMRFKDPTGNVRTKPYKVESDEQYEDIPEGAQFLDPSGKLREKPKYEGIDFTAQTLYDMAVNDKERRKALERSYPGKVKDRAGKLYIDDDGTMRRPKGFGDAPGAGLAAAAAPILGAIAGEIGGAAAGSAVPGAGTVMGAVAGGAAGGAAGQGFNDIIMGLAGVYDRSVGEEAGELALSGVSGGVGTAAGRGLAAVAPAIKGALGQGAPKAASYFLGADEDALETALGLREKGVLVPPSTWAKESPHLANVAEVFDPAFRMQKPLLQSATEHYENTAGKILEDIGVKSEGKLTDPAAAPSTQKAGEAILAKRLEAQTIADKKLKDAIAQKQLEAATGAVRQATGQASLERTAAESRKAAQSLIDIGFEDIQKDVDVAMRTAKAGHNSGDLWSAVGDKLVKIRQGIAERAKMYYAQADQAAGGHLPDTGDLPKVAQEFLDQLPEPFQAKYPDAVKKLRDLAGTVDKETGQVIKEPVDPTFGQLHELRTWFRSNIDYHDLTPGIREGVYKFFAKHVDDALHDINAVPELKTAVQLLDATDKWYGEQIRPLQDARIQAVMKGLESGLPADPKVLFDTLVKEGRTDLTRKVSSLIGPNLWAGVKAADVQQMLEASKSLVPDVIDGNAFTREVLSRSRSGMLEAVHGKEASQKLLQQAQNIARSHGKLDVAVRPGDTMTDIIAKARVAADAAKEAAQKDPLNTLQGEMKKIRNEHAKQFSAGRKADPLGFIYEPTMGAAKAVDKILESEDLILASGARFGEDSPEFNMLRQVWAQRMLMGTLEPSARLAKVSPEVQNIMFPGVSGEQMRLLAKEMDFLLSSKAGKDTVKSLAAVSKVEHPWGSIPLGKAFGKIVPGADAAGRAMLGKYYKMVTELSNNMSLMRFVQRGLKGDEQGREMARQAVQKWTSRGGAVGAGVGEAEFEAPRQ